MQWMEICTMVYCAAFGGLLGGALASYAIRANNRFNSQMLESYWKEDIMAINLRLDRQDKKLSTISGDKSVAKAEKHKQNNKNPRSNS